MSKKMFALAMLAAFGFAGVASAEITPTVKKGSSRARVEEVQAALNVCNDAGLSEDGLWGAKTTAAVKAFQADNGISKVGFVGPSTAAALNDCVSSDDEEVDTTTTTTTSEALCPNGMTLASNCLTAPASTTTTTTTTTTTISGPEGNLTNVNRLGSYNSTKVSEGEADVKVYGVEMIAKDGDQKIDGFNVAFYNSNGSSSKKFTKYATEVSVWLDGVEIGRKLASQFSDDASDVYTYRFSGMNGIVKMNQKSQLVVAVSSTGSMDSTDATNEAWAIEAGTAVGGSNTNYISAASANGRYRDFGGDLASSTIDFQKAGGVLSDQKFKVVTSSSNPAAQTIQVSQTADTNDVLLLAMDVKAENGAMVLQKLPVTIGAVDGTLDGFVPYTNGIIKSIKLYANGVKIADESVPQDGTDSATETIIFGNSSKLGYKIASNATVKFEVRADLNDTENTGVIGTDFDNGDKVAVSFTGTNLTNSTVELDNFNQDTVSNRSGSATGENQTLRSTGLQVTMGSSTTEATPNNSGEILNRTIKIPVTVKAFDESMYLAQNAVHSITLAELVGSCTAATTPFSWCTGAGTGTAPTTQAVAFNFEDSTGAVKAGSTTFLNSATWTSTDATVEGSAYRVDAGSTKNFTLTIVLTGVTGNAQKQYRVQLNKINGYTNSGLSTGQSLQDLTPVNSFESSFYTLNLN
jgi:hypothetical protein